MTINELADWARAKGLSATVSYDSDKNYPYEIELHKGHQRVYSTTAAHFSEWVRFKHFELEDKYYSLSYYSQFEWLKLQKTYGCTVCEIDYEKDPNADVMPVISELCRVNGYQNEHRARAECINIISQVLCFEKFYSYWPVTIKSLENFEIVRITRLVPPT
jgi:hypothetical protein